MMRTNLVKFALFTLVLMVMMGGIIFLFILAEEESGILAEVQKWNLSSLPPLYGPSILRVGPDTTSSSYSTSEGLAPEELVELYKKAINEVDDKSIRVRYIKRLARYYFKQGDFKQAREYYQLFKKEASSNHQHAEALQYLARINYMEQKYNAALEVLAGYQDEYGKFSGNTMLLLEGDCYRKLGQFDKAREIYEKAVKKAREGNYSTGHFTYIKNEVENRLSLLNQEENLPGTDGKIYGRVMVEGKPISEVKVCLKKTGKYSYSSGKPDFVKNTDKNGQYSFGNLQPGYYHVYIELTLHKWQDHYVLVKYDKEETELPLNINTENQEYRIDFELVKPVEVISPGRGKELEEPKLTLKWKPYPDAASYEVVFGSFVRDEKGKVSTHYGLPGRVETEETSLDYNLNNLKELDHGFSGVHINPNYILGLIYPGAEITWEVRAYDSEGKLLSTSDPQGRRIDDISYVVISWGELLPGDKELIEHKYLKALEKYLEKYEKEKKKEYIARAEKLIESFNRLWRYGHDEEINFSNYIQLLTRAAKLLHNSWYYRDIGDIYYLKLGDLDRAHRAYLKYINYIDDNDGELSSNLLLKLATLKFKAGNYLAGRDYLQQSADSYYKVIYNFLVGEKEELPLAEEWQEKINLLRKIEEYLRRDRIAEFRKLILSEEKGDIEKLLTGDTPTDHALKYFWRLMTNYSAEHYSEENRKLISGAEEMAKELSLTSELGKDFVDLIKNWKGY